MKLGMITDSLAALPFDEVLDISMRLGLDMIELGCGNWSSAPHIDIDRLISSEQVRKELCAKVRGHGLTISALNCSGNPVHPGAHGRKHDEVTRKTIRLASLLGVERVVMMSGCPGAPGDSSANWITTEWPLEVREILRWQWDEVLTPYWLDLIRYANDLGIRKLCIELHGHQNVYNVATLHKLRDRVGETVGANFDPSHLFWMGADPFAAIRALGPAIYHVHAKDTRIEPVAAGFNGLIETLPGDQFQARAWNYITLGYGHGEQWWRQFCAALAAVGYDDVLSIEHEDFIMTPIEGVEKSVSFLKDVAFNLPSRGEARL